MNTFNLLYHGKTKWVCAVWILFPCLPGLTFNATATAAEKSINFRVILVNERKEAEDILMHLQSGQAFWKLAMDRSQFPNASLGGYVEGANPQDLKHEFYATLTTLSPGELSPIIPVQEKYAILKREKVAHSKDAWRRASGLYREAIRLAAQGDFPSASEHARKALSQYPNHNAAGYILQIIQGIAQKTFERSVGLQIFESILLIHEGFPQKAQASLKKLAGSYPNTPEIQLALGEAYMVQGAYPEAIGAYEKVLSSADWATFSHLYLGAAYLQENNLPKALSHYQKAISSDIGLAQAHLGLALVYLTMGKSEESLREIRVALAIDPHLDPAYDHLGILFLTQGSVQEAVWAFEKALSIRPNYPTYLNHLGFAYNRWGIFSKAVGILEKALALAPQDPMIHNNLAIAYYDEGQMDKAIFHADRAKAMKYPVHPDFLAKLEPYRKETIRISR